MKKPLLTNVQLGNGSPRVAIVGCVHGDEPLGKYVIGSLITKLEVIRGSVNFFIAHPLALQKHKRFLETDLNRSFPGKKNGSIEEKIAYDLRKILAQFDIVIDIHSTNSNFDSLAIITKYNTKTRNLLEKVPIKNIGLAKPSVFGGNELITHTKFGIALEYGPNKNGDNYPMVTNHVLQILVNLGMITGNKKMFPKKDVYTISGQYKVPQNFKQNTSLKDFKLIRKGDVIGTANKKLIASTQNFYPIFLGKGRYKKTLSLIATKSA